MKGRDLTGQVFGKLTFLQFSHTKVGITYWLVRCECGVEKVVGMSNVVHGQTRSCGCENRAKSSARMAKMTTTHGYTKRGNIRPEFHAWNSMLDRCCNPGSGEYQQYGGRGIKVCPSWLKFENFIKDMEDRPGPRYSLDRIDVNGNYEPGNCRWTTWKQQNRNQTTTKLTPEIVSQIKDLLLKGYKQKTIARIYNIHQSQVSRVGSGKRWSPDEEGVI